MDYVGRPSGTSVGSIDQNINGIDTISTLALILIEPNVIRSIFHLHFLLIHCINCNFNCNYCDNCDVNATLRFY